jgi:hypothetical protein
MSTEMVLPRSASATASGADRGRHVGRRGLVQHGGERRGGTFADGGDIEPGHGRRQQPDIGEHREAAADAGIVVEQRDVVAGQQLAQAGALVALDGLAQAQHQLRQARRKASLLQGSEHGDGLHQRLAGAARFRDGDEARGGERQPFQQRAEGCRVEVVHEVQARG